MCMDMAQINSEQTGDVYMKDTGISDELVRQMINMAVNARNGAYAPYSGFCVGAALLTADGEIITGCNIENAAYSPGNCAERTAVFKAVSEGKMEFRAIAIAGGKRGEKLEYTSPCGVCRQVLREFVSPEDFFVIMAISEDEYRLMTLSELLPVSFGPDNLK